MDGIRLCILATSIFRKFYFTKGKLSFSSNHRFDLTQILAPISTQLVTNSLSFSLLFRCRILTDSPTSFFQVVGSKISQNGSPKQSRGRSAGRAGSPLTHFIHLFSSRLRLLIVLSSSRLRLVIVLPRLPPVFQPYHVFHPIFVQFHYAHHSFGLCLRPSEVCCVRRSA